MALSRLAIQMLGEELRSGRAKKAISFGYPVLPLQPSEISKYFGLGDLSDSFLPDKLTEKACRVHGMKRNNLVDTVKLFAKFDVELLVVDVINQYGGEIIHDLNNIISGELEKKLANADIGIDPGTTEHVFYSGKAFVELYRLVRPGGMLINIAVPTGPNHGLWAPQPKMYLRFFDRNLCTILAASLQDRDGNKLPLVDGRKRSITVPETSITVVTRKNNEDIPVTLPKDY